MADKSPKKSSPKKEPGKSLKEKRLAKKMKREPGIGAGSVDSLRDRGKSHS
jgi:hypothetical protein